MLGPGAGHPSAAFGVRALLTTPFLPSATARHAATLSHISTSRGARNHTAIYQRVADLASSRPNVHRTSRRPRCGCSQTGTADLWAVSTFSINYRNGSFGQVSFVQVLPGLPKNRFYPFFQRTRGTRIRKCVANDFNGLQATCHTLLYATGRELETESARTDVLDGKPSCSPPIL